MKIVFDSNVYLAAAKKDSYAWQQLQRARPNGPYRLFISADIILEVQNKLEQKFHWQRAASADFIEAILMYATLVQPHKKVTGVLQDKDDHIILECALEVSADVIVTSDRGLLKLKQFGTTTIFHPTILQYLR
jgi:putative PIN family toxin of toxin-antitoxin system